jgi:hypothetical protein
MEQLELRISALEALGFILNGAEYSLGSEIHISIQSLSDWTDEQYNTAINQIKAHIAAHPNQYPQESDNTLLPAIQLIPTVIASIQGKSGKVISAFDKLNADIDANGGMNDELDSRANKGLLYAANVAKEIEAEYKPITSTMDLIKKQILSYKNDIDPKKEGTGAAKVQAHRNKYAADKEAERQSEIKRLQAIADKEAEYISLKSKLLEGVNNWFNNLLLTKKQAMTKFFNETTLENFDARSSWFDTCKIEFTIADYAKFDMPLHGKLHDTGEVADIIIDGVSGNKELFAKFQNDYFEGLNSLRLEYLEQFPSKRMELIRQKEAAEAKIAADLEAQRIADEMKHADVAKQAELAAQQAENKRKADEAAEQLAAETAARIARENEAAKKLQDEADARKKADEVAAKAAAAQAESNSLFSNAMITSSVTTAGPKRKTEQQLVITEPNGIIDAFTFWFVNEGNTWTPEELTKKFGFIFTFANKQANNGKYLVSKYAKYIDVTTAQVDKKA